MSEERAEVGVTTTQLEADVATLRQVFEGFERLEAMYQRAWEMMSPGSRGYFTPDEDNEVRRMLLAYRNYRLASWDIIWRHYNAYRLPLGNAADRLRSFMIGYATALTLFRKSLRLVEIAEFDPMLRAKLNEPDRKFDLAGGFFEDVLVSYSSVYNYFRILAASVYWRRNRKRVRELGLHDDALVGWLVPVIATERKVLRGKFWVILGKRLRRDWRGAWRLLRKPVKLFAYRSGAGIASIVAQLRLRGFTRGIGQRQLAHLGAILRPGDILLMRADDKITSALLPGFWAHAAIFVGTWDTLARLRLTDDPKVYRLKEIIARLDQQCGLVVEAVPRGCRVHSLAYSLQVDHVAVLRPNIDEATVRESLLEAFGHVGKPYDFEFDFNVTTRIVCTELIYRSFHGRGPINFGLLKRLGRFTLSVDDMVEQFLREPDGKSFSLVELLLKEGQAEAVPVPVSERVTRLAALLRRPQEDTAAA